MSKRTKLAIFIGAIAAVISAVVVVIVFWDKLLTKCPCCKQAEEVDEVEEPEVCEEVVAYTEEETAAFADLGDAEEVAE